MTRISLMITLALTSMLALGACGGKKKGGAKGNPWLGKALKAQRGQVKGVGYSVQIPDGFKEKKDGGRMVYLSGGDFDYPQVEVTDAYNAPKTPEEAKKKHTAGKLNKGNLVQKAVATKGGILITYKAKKTDSQYVHFYLPAGKVTLRCSALYLRSYDAPKIPQADKTFAWLEKICLTLAKK